MISTIVGSHVEFRQPVCLAMTYTLLSLLYDFIFPVLLFQPEHSNVCFWYLPKRVQNIPPGPERDRELHMVIQEIKPFSFF